MHTEFISSIRKFLILLFHKMEFFKKHFAESFCRKIFSFNPSSNFDNKKVWTNLFYKLLYIIGFIYRTLKYLVQNFLNME